MNLRHRIRDKALELGFDAIGFAPANLTPKIADDLYAFCEAGLHGDMGWIADRRELRSHPQKLWPEAKSVIALALSYGGSDPYADANDPQSGRISIYARNKDYHDVIKKKLREMARFISAMDKGQLKFFVDTAPIMEKPLAQIAGLGWQGKHTNLVSRQLGSWFFLSIILTDFEIEPDEKEIDHCGSCQQCLDICPTQAFLAPHRLDARRCISYLTIEHKGPIDFALRPLLGNRIYGCDDCLAICPWNKFATSSKELSLQERPELQKPLLKEWGQWDDSQFRHFFSGSPIKRIGRNRFIRNILYAIGNSKDDDFVPLIQPLLRDSSPLVRSAAVWAIGQLLSFEKALAFEDPLESDPIVKEEWEYLRPHSPSKLRR